MPITKQAEKKLRHDKVVTKQNIAKRTRVRDAVKTMRKTPSIKQLKTAFSVLDTAVKTHIIHKNKADRLKSRLAKLIAKK